MPKSPYEPQGKVCICNGSPYTICAACISKRRSVAWWANAPRSGFTARAEREQPRMAQSLTGRKVGSMVVGSGPAVTGGRGK